jgi:broad specificity phosphatase PhoE
MSPTVRYLTHPQVLKEPLKDGRSWSLNSVGASRVARLASRLSTLRLTRHVSSSAETTAVDTARPLATALGVDVDIHETMSEVDRTATGSLSEREFERTATDFFSRPQKSIRGWEAASAAQERIMSAVDACLNVRLEGDVLIVGHWSVGTLLFCGLSGHSIDQNLTPDPGGGFWFEFDSQSRLPAGGWRPMEAL